MKRLYVMLPSADSCRAIVAELRQAGIRERHLHVIASLAVPLDDLPEAGLLQKSELAHGIEHGIALGGTAGLLGGILVLAFPPVGLIVGGAQLVAAVTAGGAGLGALTMGLIAKDIHSKALEDFESDIAHGRVLLIVDVPKAEIARWKQVIVAHHPEAQIGVAAPSET